MSTRRSFAALAALAALASFPACAATANSGAPAPQPTDTEPVPSPPKPPERPPAGLAPPATASASATAPPPATAAATAPAPHAPPAGPITVAQTLALLPISGAFTLIGHVVDSYTCPDCPPRATCKPCIGEFVVVSDAPPGAKTSGGASPARVNVYTERDKLTQLAVGKKYRFEVRPTPGDRLELVSAAPAN